MDSIKKQVISESKIKVNACFWDTAGQERFSSLQKGVYKKCHTLIFCFDMNNIQSFEFVNNMAKDLVNDNNHYNIPFAYLTKKNCDKEKDIINKLHGKIFYYDDEDKTGIDDGIGYLANEFIEFQEKKSNFIKNKI